METRDPVSAFLKWYDTLSADLQAELAFVVLYLLPDYPLENLETAPSGYPELFRLWLDNPADDAARTAGRLVCIRGLVDFFVVRSFGAKETWEKDVRIHKKILAELQATGEGKGELIGFSTRLEGQGMSLKPEWEAAAATWTKLCQELLSDKYLETWTFDTLPDPHFRQGRRLDPQEPDSYYDGVVKG
jgi:hypothetical protein